MINGLVDSKFILGKRFNRTTRHSLAVSSSGQSILVNSHLASPLNGPYPLLMESIVDELIVRTLVAQHLIVHKIRIIDDGVFHRDFAAAEHRYALGITETVRQLWVFTRIILALLLTNITISGNMRQTLNR